jgi:DNA-binding CsgD family transcriptional regulator
MVEVTIADLRAATDLGRAALDVRTGDDVTALLRRLRHLVPCHVALLHQIHPQGITHWADPGPPTGRPDHRLVASDAIGDSVVHISLWRCDEPFGDRDHQLLALARPYLASAVAIVGHGVLIDPAVSDSVELTAREVQVLSLITDGATNKEVGSQLGISARTVQKHLEHIYDKLGTHRRTAAARWFSNQLAGR